MSEYENAPNSEKGAILRREGLYSSPVIEWTRARDAGVLTGKPAGSAASAKRPKKSAEQVELEKLRRQNEKLKSDLAKTRMALDIMGKAHALLDEFSGSAENEEPPTTAFTALRAAQLSVQKSCGLTGISRATHYRHAHPRGRMHGPWLPRTPPPRR